MQPVSGDVFVADKGNCVIRKIVPRKGHCEVSTFVGSPGQGGSTSGVGQNARFRTPSALAFEKLTGSLVLADAEARALWEIT